MFLDLFNLDKARRAVLYAIYLLLVLLFQNMVFSRITVLGVRAMFVPAAVVAVGMFEGGVWGGVFGLFAGLLCDLSYGNAVLFAALFPVVGFCAGLLSRWFVNRRFFAYLIVCLGAFALTAFCQLFRLWVVLDQAGGPLFATAALQVLWSLPLAVPLYFPCRSIART